MKRILAFSFFPAFTPASNGGEIRLFNFYLSLSRFHHVTLLSSGFQGAEEQVINHGSQFVERRIAKDDYFSRHWSELAPHDGGGDMSGPCIAASGRHPTALHRAYLEEYERADVIIHDSPFTVDYDLFAGLDSKLRLYNAYNCEADLYRALHPHEHCKPIHDLVEQAERRLLEAADCVLYCNEDDLQSFKRLASEASYDTLSVPNGHLALASVAPRQASTERFSAVFMGSGHLPNVEAALFIANELAPRVPDVTFDILGNCLPEGRYPANVIRHGLVSVEQKQELLQRAHIALNPMNAGSGSNVKVFDYFAHSLPVLSTAIGLRGVTAIDGEHVLLAALDEFASVLSGWRECQDQWQTVGAAGHALGRDRYGWDTLVRPVAVYLDGHEKRLQAPHQPVLVLNDYNSFTSVGGGATRTRGLYAAVSQWAPVLFLCFSSDEQLRVDRYGASITVISVPKTIGHISEQMRVNALSVISADDIVASSECVKNELLLRIYNLAKAQARVIAVEHPYMAAIPCLFADRFVYSSQNNEALLKRRLFAGHPEGEALIEQVALLERTAVERAAAVVAVSDDDALSLTCGVQTAGPMVVVRNGSEVPCLPDAADLQSVMAQFSQPSAVFLGSAHPPNIEAVQFIVHTLAPACPDVQFHIIGGVCGAVNVRADSNVKLWGILDDSMKSAVMQSCTLAVNPMSSGSGSNVKLADFLGNGLHTVTTEFGQRGYPQAITPHVSITSLERFASELKGALGRVHGEPVSQRDERRRIFSEYLSMQALGKEYVTLLQSLEATRKRVLFVTYRYVAPALGGAESMIENLLRALDGSGGYDIDLVSAQVSSLQNHGRFTERYLFDQESAAFTGLRHTRFARFEVDSAGPVTAQDLPAAWTAQCVFERELYLRLQDGLQSSGLAWGWGGAQPCGPRSVERWAFCSSGLHVHADARLVLHGSAPVATALLIQDQQGHMLYSGKVSGDFVIEFQAQRGMVQIQASSPAAVPQDPRPLAFLLRRLSLNDQLVDLSDNTVCDISSMTPQAGFDALHEAAEASRRPLGLRLTDLRGPWSSGLEMFLAANIARYDLVVTHNVVFRPAVAAIELARQHGVPSIVIPHAHLDDDYYHFPDVLDCALQADLVLAAPRAACDFYSRRGARVDYLPAGIDVDESFTADDVAAFRALFPDERPFVLVLGRKAGAKGYQQIIDTVAGLPVEYGMQVVLIGPDDDGVTVHSSCATYLGRQPREVVRGALMSCLALVNMSTSESFGIVLLEAWMAGRPVVVNRGCAAFHDMAIDEYNALLVDAPSLRAGLLRLAADESLCRLLAGNGRATLQRYDWKQVGQDFIEHCNTVLDVQPTHERETV